MALDDLTKEQGKNYSSDTGVYRRDFIASLAAAAGLTAIVSGCGIIEPKYKKGPGRIAVEESEERLSSPFFVALDISFQMTKEENWKAMSYMIKNHDKAVDYIALREKEEEEKSNNEKRLFKKSLLSPEETKRRIEFEKDILMVKGYDLISRLKSDFKYNEKVRRSVQLYFNREKATWTWAEHKELQELDPNEFYYNLYRALKAGLLKKD